jgi:hypothetical protein
LREPAPRRVDIASVTARELRGVVVAKRQGQPNAFARGHREHAGDGAGAEILSDGTHVISIAVCRTSRPSSTAAGQ